MSEKKTVVEALTAVMAEVQPVGKRDRNTEQGYNFRGIDAVVNAVGPVLRKHGVIVLPMLEEANHRDVLTSRDKKSRESTVRVRYRFYGPAGDCIEAVVPGEAMDFGDKGVAKAMSVAYRILLLQTLCIPTDEPDPDEQSYERAATPAATQLQVENFDAIAKQIAAVESKEGLRKPWEAVLAAYKADDITTRQANELKAEIAKRKAEINDSTGDSDGSGVATGGSSAGAGPDSQGAGDGGPGLGGETGSGGPGVQPRVHGGNRVDRVAQTHSGDRNTPAAAGF